MIPRRLILVLLIALIVSVNGCTDFLAGRIVKAPNYKSTITDADDPSAFSLNLWGAKHFLRVTVGPPDATLAVWVIDPPEDARPIGTVLFLHGYGDRPFWMHGKAKALAAHGYRSVLVGHRGYSRSSGKFRTFGVVEKRDLSQVVDRLEAEGLLAGKLGVWGMSYGAAVAIQFAGHDDRVAAAVAVAPFSSLRNALPHFGRMTVPVVTWLMSDDDFDELLDQAGELASFDPDEADATVGMKSTAAPVLLMHGTADLLIPFRHSELLMQHANDKSKLSPVPLAGHMGIWFDLTGQVATESREWFDQWLR